MPDAKLHELLRSLRGAKGDEGRVAEALGASTRRLREDDAYRQALAAELNALVAGKRMTHAFTEMGLLSDEAIAEGVFRRLGERVAPAPLRDDALDDTLRELFGRKDRGWLARVRVADVQAWLLAVGVERGEWENQAELASAMVILATRVAGAGMDARLTERVPSLERWSSPFLELSRHVDVFAETLASEATIDDCAQALATVERCRRRVVTLREKKKQLGTTLRLSSASLRMLQQLDRLSLLIACATRRARSAALAELGLELARDACRRRPTSHFLRQKLDLVAYLMVGHAAQKGAGYAVNDAAEYRAFWLKSLFGGLIVSIFASLKIHLSHEHLAPVPQALLYGVNYAVCFLLIFLFGATLATKQPALTASRLAETLGAGEDASPSFVELVRAIWRSQFVSFMGNILGAAAFAVLFAIAFEHQTGEPLVSVKEAQKLTDKMHPWESGTMFYAAVAGGMLSLAGFIAGFVDNAMIFHLVSERVQQGRGVFRLIPTRWLRERLAKRIEAQIGGAFGNVVLGFMLGSAGAFGVIFGVPFDIRHIAFSSSHAALALHRVPEAYTAQDVGLLLLAVTGIGFINFLVSFSLTLSVAINAQRLEGVDWRAQLRALWRLLTTRPFSFVLPRE